ncbi:galectin-4 isoform X19 [Oreochromis niloticus]|uniref:galectin-4 isoform X18 n=1 Tax=Oreochromis niloticus TaxID=8128 RepID=UPI000DF3FAB5|nr:galectin-4 isoform X18 [Oreochromis niloticus]XP_025753875.1 galectin-4 isoform X19 [Oreochromis niloticus]
MSVQWDPDHQRLRAPWRTRPCSRIESHLDLVGLADPPGLFLAHSAVTRMMDDLLGSAASRRTSGNSWFLCVPENIPYLGPINGGLREGMSIYIQGTIPKHINRFFINLICGEYESSDIALHFNPRFDGWDKVVFNTCQNGSWGSEEKIHRMPFRKGEHFEMVIIVNFQGYQIKVNGIDFHTFQHRIPMEQVRGLQIAGDVSIQMINFIGGGMGGGMGGGYPGGGMGGGYPGGMGGGMGPGGYPGGDMGDGYPGGMGGGMGGAFPGSNLPGMSGQPVYNPPVPYSSIIQGGMFPKRTIVIRGMVPYGAHKLSIKFLVSRSRDVAFHIHPRFREGIVLRNSMIGGNWGQEEREMSMNPFMEGQYFDMSIRCGNQRFKVFVNGQHLFDFFHRWQSFNEIDMLEIEGDVQISYIHF